MKFIRIIKCANKLSEDDFEIYKDGDYYKVKKLTDNARNSGVTTWDIYGKNYYSTSYKLGVRIQRYNDKDLIQYRKSLLMKLNKLFKQAGLQKMVESTTRITGFHNLVQGGYYFDTKYLGNNSEFKIGVYFGFNTSLEHPKVIEYLDKIKDILNKEKLQYTENGTDIEVKLDENSINNAE